MVFRKHGKGYIVTLIVALLVVGGYVFYKVKKHDFLNHQLKDLVKEKTHQLYNVNYDSISVDEIGGDLYIRNIYIKGDTARELQMINNKDTNASAAVFDIYVPLLKVIDFKTARALLSKQLECSRIVISNPQVHIYLFPGQGKQKDNKTTQEQLYKQILGNFKLIKADSVSVLNSQVVASDFFTREVKFHAYNTTVNLDHVAIDSTFNQDTSRTLFCKEITINAAKVVLGDKKNTAEIMGATFNTRSKIVALSSFSYDAFKNNGFFKSTLKGISLDGIEWKGPADSSELNIDKIIISEGDVDALLKGAKENKDKSGKEPKILTGWIKKFSLNSLRVNSVNVTSRTSDPKSKPFIVRNNAFTLKNVNIDQASKFDESLIHQAKEIQLHNDEISVRSADNRYVYKVSGITLNTKTKKLFISSIAVIPQLDEAAFARKAHYQTDRYDIKMRNIDCSNVNIEKLIKGNVDIESVTSQGSSLKIFRDLSYPVDTISTHGQQVSYPQQALFQLGILIRINRVISSNTYIEYKEKNATSHNSGRVRFSNAYLTIDNVSTNKPKAGEKTTAKFKALFLDKIPLTGGFSFRLDQWQKGTFSAEASVSDTINATMLNQLTEPMGLIQLQKGMIKSIKFSMNADTNTSHATLIIPYENLKIALLKKKEDQYNKKGIFSLLANLIVKNNNKESVNMRTATITLTRNKYRTFFNFIWMTIFKGIKEVCVLKL